MSRASVCGLRISYYNRRRHLLDLPFLLIQRSTVMAEGSRPPQTVALYAAGGGFAGALLAILVAKILMGPCCCTAEQDHRAASAATPATEAVVAGRD
jgi:hypothetical protein